jgi:hypothetical protein
MLPDQVFVECHGARGLLQNGDIAFVNDWFLVTLNPRLTTINAGKASFLFMYPPP